MLLRTNILKCCVWMWIWSWRFSFSSLSDKQITTGCCRHVSDTCCCYGSNVNNNSNRGTCRMWCCDQSSSTGSADGKKNFGFVSVIFRINFNNSASGYTDSTNLTHGKLIKLVRFTLIFHQFSLYSHLVEEKSADLHLFTNKSIFLSK